MTQTNTNQQAIAAMKNVMMATIARIENAHTLMWITTKAKWSFTSYVKVGLNGKKHGHTEGASGLIDLEQIEKMYYEAGGVSDIMYWNLFREVKELQAWKKLVSDIVQQQDGSHLREMLKELIE